METFKHSLTMTKDLTGTFEKLQKSFNKTTEMVQVNIEVYKTDLAEKMVERDGRVEQQMMDLETRVQTYNESASNLKNFLTRGENSMKALNQGMVDAHVAVEQVRFEFKDIAETYEKGIRL